MEAQIPGAGGESASEAETTILPATIGPYVVMRRLGGGGMGVVDLCRTVSGRLVAVKQVREEFADDPAFRSRFRREVATARRVSGVYTVPVVDADTEGPRPWIATTYIAGPTLDQALRTGGTMREPALRALGTALAEALQVIHAEGLVHRDIKPGNILLSSDGPRVIDFGIAKALGDTRLTHTGTVIGSPAFMAPEQIASSHDTGPEADVFALAGILVYAACGEGPFGPGDEGVLHRVVTAEPDMDGVPPALRPLLLRCLDKTPSRRPTPEQILAELAPAQPDDLLTPALRADLAARAQEAELMAVVPPPPGTLPGTRPGTAQPSRRRVLLGALAAAGVLAAGGTAVLATRGGGDAKKGTGGAPLGTSARTIELTDPPKPLWSTPLPVSVALGQATALGSTVVAYDSGSTAVAFDAASGRVRWLHGIGSDGRLVTGNDPFGATGRFLGTLGSRLLVTGTSTPKFDPSSGKGFDFGLHSYVATADPASARPVGKQNLPVNVMPGTMLAAHDQTVYCQITTLAAMPSYGATPAPTATADTGQKVAAIDLATGNVRWTQPLDAGGSLFGIRYSADRHGFYFTQDTDSGLTVHALDAASGRTRWSVKVPADPDNKLPPYMQAGGGELNSSLTAAGDLLITVNIKGGMTAYDAATGRRRWSVSMTAASAPTVVGDLVLTNELNRVQAVDLRDGSIRWRVQSPVQLSSIGMVRTLAASKQVTAVVFSPLTLDSKGASVPGTAGCLALRTSDGRELWALREKPSAGATASPSPRVIGSLPAGIDLWSVAVDENNVYITGGNRVRAYRADAG
ncbi:PQQ-binding-like beta-propeller repeat protein [Streptomyces sp. NPDC046821]|uniref:protein kinase domain-containing protein n=1 Tax=Streptomyces sp. NPDC046821 TaxID=3154702 RepID=UPI0033EEC2AC